MPVQILFYILNGLILFIVVFNLPEDMSFLLAISHISEKLVLRKDDLHNFRGRSEMFGGILLEKLVKVVFLNIEQHSIFFR